VLKVILQLYPMLPARDEAEREALRPLGRDRERYQDAIAGWHDIIRAADELGSGASRPSNITFTLRAMRSARAPVS
jgi:hypothetical protein